MPISNEREPSAFEKWAPWIAGVALAAPVLIARYPPMTDLPHHEAIVGILRRFGDASMFPPGLYVHNFGQPNQLFHLLAWALSYLVATDTACKLVVAASVVAIPVGAARLAEHVGASRLSALAVAPLALGWFFAWGLVANMIGLAALLALLPVLDRFVAAPTGRGLAAALGGVVALYFAHEAMMVIYAGAALVLTLCRPLDAKKTPLGLAPLFFGILVAFGQVKYQNKYFFSPTLQSAAKKTVFIPLRNKLLHVPDLVFSSQDRPPQLLLFGLFVLALVLLAYLRARERRAQPRAAGFRAWLARYRFELVALGLLGAYLVFPMTLNGATLVHQRFFPPAFAILVVTLAPRDLANREGKLARFLLPVLPLGALLLAWPSFADATRMHRDLDQILARIDKGSSVMWINLVGDPSRDWSPGPAPARVLAERGGRVLYTFTDSSIAAAYLPPEHQWNEPLQRVAFDSWKMRPAHDLTRFRYLIVHSSDPEMAVLASMALRPEARPIANAGEYLLFESTLPVAPLMSPDVPLPDPKPATIRKRMRAALEQYTPDLRERATPPDLPSTDEAEPGSAHPGDPP